MSTKLKINIILLLIMACSTGYFLKLIDGQERILTAYEAQQIQIKQSKYYNGPPDLDMEIRKMNGGKLDTDITYESLLFTRQIIDSLYRYMLFADLILLISIFVISKSFNNSKAAGI